ncbi:MMPL family transporter [Algiphilus sp.]|uniref:efflux RND transporter permease subunit n=1 Tax=Algiphilus sp. TaxID=1872431 RepID=UPI0025C684EC|nr:MMPL family transporter [Algiphilus sp.]MCK5770995.1 MMPL family transporter [Algiphilus sp.]
MTVAERYAAWLVARRRPMTWLLLALTLLVGAGAGVGERSKADIGEAAVRSAAHEAADEIEATYRAGKSVSSQIVVRAGSFEGEGGEVLLGNVLTRASLLRGLELQRAIRAEQPLAETLREDGFEGIENLIARLAWARDRGIDGLEGPEPDLAAQIDALAALSDAETESLLAELLDPASPLSAAEPRNYLPSDYVVGSTRARARATHIRQHNPASGVVGEDAVLDAQARMDVMARAAFPDAFVSGRGVVKAASVRAVGDSFVIITPVALILLVLALTIAYRDVWDILLSLLGAALVLIWLSGLQGWLAIPRTSLLIAVPFLLVGLSIDYSLHIVMRYREARTDAGEPDTAAATTVAVGGVMAALVTAAVTTALAFFANVISPLASIRDFALVSGLGILSALLVFGALVPALKIGMDQWLERRGRTRRSPAVGLRAGWMHRLLRGVAALSARHPGLSVAGCLLLAVGGAVAATGIDTRFDPEDFMPREPPAWVRALPEPFAPGNYDARADLAYVKDTFRQNPFASEAQVLIKGEVTAPGLLTAVERVARGVTAHGTIITHSPAFALRRSAGQFPELAALMRDRDDDGDGLPDRDVAAVFDRFIALDSERAGEVLHRAPDGAYESARLRLGILVNAPPESIAADVRELANRIEAEAPVRAVATGLPVVQAVIQRALFETLVNGFAVTLVLILALLASVYGRRFRMPALGVLFLVPVVVALAWLLGAMAVLGIPFNSETVVITSLAIGLGVDYCVHLGERLVAERAAGASVADALTSGLCGTGGALLGSALTTLCGFGVLALAFSPPLQRFGTVSGLSIAFAFIACIVMLPGLFALRERWRSGNPA